MPSISGLLDSHPHLTEVIIGVAATVVGTALIGCFVLMVKAFGQRTGLRVGANWTWEGTTSDPRFMTLHPNINVVSRSNAPKVILHSIWVRDSKSNRKPGRILGKIDLVSGSPIENRTTGGDPLNLVGPTIKCANLNVEVEKTMRCPVWIQTSDNRWYKAQSMGNPPSLADRIREVFRR